MSKNFWLIMFIAMSVIFVPGVVFSQDNVVVIDLDIFVNEVSNNIFRADELYDGKRLRVEGYISNFAIDHDNKASIFISASRGRLLGSLLVSFQSDISVLETLSRLEKDQIIIVDGDYSKTLNMRHLINCTIFRLPQPTVSRRILEVGIVHNAGLLAQQINDNVIWAYLNYDKKIFMLSGYIREIRKDYFSDTQIIELGGTVSKRELFDSIDIYLNFSENTKVINLNKGQVLFVEGTIDILRGSSDRLYNARIIN